MKINKLSIIVMKIIKICLFHGSLLSTILFVVVDNFFFFLPLKQSAKKTTL